METDTQPVIYTPEEVATILHTSGHWIRARIRAGQFPHLRVGKQRILITEAQLQQILTICTHTPDQLTAPVVRRIGTRAKRTQP